MNSAGRERRNSEQAIQRGEPQPEFDVPPTELPPVKPLTHFWFWRKKLPDRKGEPCRVLARGNKNSILVEFADGHQVVTSRFAVRKGEPVTFCRECTGLSDPNVSRCEQCDSTNVEQGIAEP